ncbi:MAG: hypothetical protein IPG95_08280 [Saprospiraceae bacterium]|nr:hypothetical protein [Saprospiraceae bacterium]
MNTKTLISGLLGGVCYFLLGWLIYGVLLKDAMNSSMGSATGVMRGEADMLLWAIAIGNIATGLGMAYILGNWAGVTSWAGGAKAAATVGALFAIGYDLIMYATSNMMELNGIFMDVPISIFMSASAGAVIGWWLGRS